MDSISRIALKKDPKSAYFLGRKLFYFVCLFFTWQATFAQKYTLPFRRYTTNDGLSNDNVYDITKDSKGRLWIATEFGISRFDGKNFETQLLGDGTNDNLVSSIEFLRDTLYLGVFQKGLMVYKPNGLSLLIDPKKNPTFISQKNGKIFAEYLYGAGTSLYSATNLRFFKGSKLSNESIENAQFLRTVKKTNSSPFYYLKESGNQSILYKNDKLYSRFVKINEPLYCIDEISVNEFLVGTVGKILHIKNGTVAKEYLLNRSVNQKIYQVFRDRTNRIWTRDIFGNAYLIAPDGEIYPINELLKLETSASVRTFFYDTQDEIVWIGTSNEGLLAVVSPFLSNYDLRLINDNSNNILSLALDAKNRLWIGTEKHLNFFSGNSFLNIKDNTYQNINNLQVFNNQLLVGYKQTFSFSNTKNYFAKKVEGQDLIYRNSSPFYQTASGMFADNENKYFGNDGSYKDISNAFFGQLTWQTKSVQRTPEGWLDTRIHHINHYLNRHDTLWISTDRGLLWVIKNTCYEPFFGKDINKHLVKKVVFCPSGDYYILGEKSLVRWQNGKILDEKKSIGNIKIGAVNDITFDNKNRIWVGSENGLILIDKDKTFQFDRTDGLSHNSINTLLHDASRNCIWLGTSNGLDRFSIDLYEKQQFFNLEVIIEKISNLKNKNYAIRQSLTIPSDDNNLKIFLGTNSLQNPSTIQFQYAIDDGQWVNSNEIIELAAISFGKHHVAIRAKNRNSDWGKITHYYFHVQTPFYQTWYFISLVILAISLFAYWRVRVNNKENAEKFSLQNQITELKQQGLAAMMNPHFIFNSLNSIQYLVNSDNLPIANDFLAKFGKLIRMNLDVASRATISLNEELKRLELYLSLEKMRFGDKVNYRFDIDPHLDKDKTQIPTMMIQPFIENSILHGLAPIKNKSGVINIIFTLKATNLLNIQIIDNGIGLTASKKLNISKHVSKGMQIIRERIELMNKKHLNSENKNFIAIKEVFHKEESVGTKVEIQFETELIS